MAKVKWSTKKGRSSLLIWAITAILVAVGGSLDPILVHTVVEALGGNPLPHGDVQVEP